MPPLQPHHPHHPPPSTDDAQRELQQRLAEYKRNKQLLKMRAKAKPKNPSPFVVSVPKNDKLADFVPSVVRGVPSTDAPTLNSRKLNHASSATLQHPSQWTAHPRCPTTTTSTTPARPPTSHTPQELTSNHSTPNTTESLQKHVLDALRSSVKKAKKWEDVVYARECERVVMDALEKVPRPVHDRSGESAKTRRVDFTPAENGLEPGSTHIATFEAAAAGEEPYTTKIEQDDVSPCTTPPRSVYIDNVFQSDVRIEMEAPVVGGLGEDADAGNMEGEGGSTPVAAGRTRKGTQGTPYPRSVKREAVVDVEEGKDAADEMETLLRRMSIKDTTEMSIRDGMGEENAAGDVKPEMESEDVQAAAARRGEVVVGNVGSGSATVVVLTPRKASRKERDELGVPSVVTNARRSIRFLTPHKSAASTADEKGTPVTTDTAPDARERVQKLLEEHGNAFVPNKVLSMPKLGTPTGASHHSRVLQPAKTPPFLAAAAARRTALTPHEGTENTPSSPFVVHDVKKGQATPGSGPRTRSRA